MDARWSRKDNFTGFSPNYQEISKQYYTKKSCWTSSVTLAFVTIFVGMAIISATLYISILLQ